MKSSLLVFLLLLATLPQEPATTAPDLQVLKFRCGKQQTTSSLIHSVQEPDTGANEPIRVNKTSRNEPQAVQNNRDMQERRAEMAIAEKTAELSTQKNSTLYFYKIEVQNTGAKTVKSFAWEYRPSNEPDPSNRQFYCVINAKTNEKKDFDLFSPYAPSRVVDVSNPQDKPNAEKKDKIIINKIEYTDGTVWKREGWNPKTFQPEDTNKVGGGKCIGI